MWVTFESEPRSLKFTGGEMILKLFRFGLFVVLVIFVMLPAGAWALSLDTAKARGLVGEQPSGYLGIVAASPEEEVRALVTRINAERRKAYAAIADKNGTALSVVEQISGKKAIESTEPGNFVLSPSGKWVRK